MQLFSVLEAPTYCDILYNDTRALPHRSRHDRMRTGADGGRLDGWIDGYAEAEQGGGKEGTE